MGKKGKKHTTKGHQQNKRKENINREKFQDGLRIVQTHPVFSNMFGYTSYHYIKSVIVEMDSYHCPKNAWAIITNDGVLHPNLGRFADAKVWAYVVAHCLLHLGLGHFQQKSNPVAWNMACDYVVGKFLANFKIGEPPTVFPDIQLLAKTEDDIYAHFLGKGIPEKMEIFGMSEQYICDMEIVETSRFDFLKHGIPEYGDLFAQGLRAAMQTALRVVSNRPDTSGPSTMVEEAQKWFINNYPLLGALAASFEIIEDVQACHSMQISIAAVDSEAKRLYFNPASYSIEHDRRWSEGFAAKLNGEQEIRFVMAHELMHVALRHQARRQGRDPYLWNVACDYVINDWLLQMGVGRLPEGCLYDPELRGLNAESIYDRIVNDIRTYRKLATLRGVGLCDVLEGTTHNWWDVGEGIRLDEFYRRALAQGFEYHCNTNRGFLPAGLIEEIHSVSQPPIPWDVQLAHWFDARFPPLEKRRTYARPSRRQSSTPDIPRPSYALYEADVQSRVFGVVLDTSGSMETKLLAKALGTIASYSQSRDVQSVRVVFCDATPYDAGYMLPEDIAERVEIKGRGGTILQPGIDLLETADDFPSNGPILVITDGYCDVLTVHHDHAYLMPDGHRLPFSPRGDVFYIHE